MWWRGLVIVGYDSFLWTVEMLLDLKLELLWTQGVTLVATKFFNPILTRLQQSYLEINCLVFTNESCHLLGNDGCFCSIA